jgi:hypothetical protein
MRTHAPAPNWPPSQLDEIANLLINVPYPYFRPTQQRDSEYGLVIALAELGDSLGLEPGDRKGAGDRQSLVADATRALKQLGPLVRARIPAIADVLSALKSFEMSGDDANRNRAARHVSQLQADLADRETGVAAFDDLLDIAQDSTASHIAVTARLEVLTGVLELGDPLQRFVEYLGASLTIRPLRSPTPSTRCTAHRLESSNGSTNQQG